MVTWKQLTQRLLLATALAFVTMPSSGCALGYWFARDAIFVSRFWGTTPLIPVTPYFSQQIEDTYWEEERYAKVPILDPLEGENAPEFCLDPPSPDEVIRALPDDDGSGGVQFLAETTRNNVRMTVDLIVDRVDDCRVIPHAGPVRLHHCHYKCTVFYDKVIRSHWPVPFTHNDNVQQVVYIDHDHFIRCGGPDSTDITLDQIH